MTMSNVKSIPDGASVIIPRLVCRDPVAEIDFCTKIFGAVEQMQRPGPDGRVAHALITIGPAMVMLESEWPPLPFRAPELDGRSSVVLYVYVEDVDRAIERAQAAGARILIPLTNQFWGDRTAWIMDPAGHVWTVATRIEETTEEVRKQRLADLLAKAKPSAA